MVETPEQSITDKLSELLGKDSSTVAPYTAIQEHAPPVITSAPTTPVNNIEPRNTDNLHLLLSIPISRIIIRRKRNMYPTTL